MELFDLDCRASRLARPAAARIKRTLALAALVTCLAAPAPALADKISNPIAVFDGLDKITGRIISFEVKINETVQFGTLQITPRVCYSRPPTDPPQTDAFAQVDEIDEKKTVKRIFSGWMFADSPGLHGVEHPIFDIWLTGCEGGTVVMHDAPAAEAVTPTLDQSPPADAGDASSPAEPAKPAKAQAAKRKKPKPASTVVVEPASPADPPTDPPQATSGAARTR